MDTPADRLARFDAYLRSHRLVSERAAPYVVILKRHRVLNMVSFSFLRA